MSLRRCTVSAPPPINKHCGAACVSQRTQHSTRFSIRRTVGCMQTACVLYGGTVRSSTQERVLERRCARRDVRQEVFAERGRPGDLVLQKYSLHPTDGSGEAGNGKVDEREIATTSTIVFCDLYDTNILCLGSKRERCAINGLGIVNVVGGKKGRISRIGFVCPVSSWLHLRTFSTSLMLTKTGLSSVLPAR